MNKESARVWRDPGVTISASGTTNSGRALHHLHTLQPGPRNSLVFGDLQAQGTCGNARAPDLFEKVGI
ncbi:hypothetical protein [Marinobacter sp.]|uniref:hypothetical protein n=1 Tax=Marinobacter sp. TaxID=50741 RepID=UPI0035C71410